MDAHFGEDGFQVVGGRHGKSGDEHLYPPVEKGERKVSSEASVVSISASSGISEAPGFLQPLLAIAKEATHPSQKIAGCSGVNLPVEHVQLCRKTNGPCHETGTQGERWPSRAASGGDQ